MALDWSKSKRRDQRNAARGNEAELARLIADDVPQLSKAELRALGVVALADYRKPIKRLPTIIYLKCGCGHKGHVKVYPGEPRKRFRCSKCNYLSM